MNPKLREPARARLAEALAVCDGRDDAPAAWEALASADLIPMEWIHHPTRSYIVEARGGARRAYYPPTVEFCSLLAADAAAVQAAEEIARECLREVKNRDAVLWRLVSGGSRGFERASFETALGVGAIRLPDRFLEYGFWVDTHVTDRIALLMPTHEPDAPLAYAKLPPRTG